MMAGSVLWIGRTAEKAAPWRAVAEASGWEARTLPLITTVPLEVGEAERRQLLSMCGEDTLFLTSALAVQRLVEVLDGEPLPSTSYAVVGNATGSALQEARPAQVAPELTAPQGNGLSLARAFLATGPPEQGRRIFFGAKVPNPGLGEALHQAGLPVEHIPAYAVAVLEGPAPPEGQPILVFSPSGIRSLFGRTHLPSSHPVLAVGPTTADAARELGFPLRGVLDRPSPSSLTAHLNP